MSNDSRTKRSVADVTLLERLGSRLDAAPRDLHGRTVREFLCAELLRIRDKRGRLVPFELNAAQREYARTCTRRNIVLKARQLGITTYVAARFFLNTITRPGTLSVQVAHDQRSAEEIFRIVHRFFRNLPPLLREGALETSRANVRQIVFPRLDSEYRVETAADPNAGRGLTIQNLHCSEVARWPRDAAATLASLRAAVPPDGEVVLESTPNGAAGCFYEEWQKAEEKGYTRHFLPWWWEPAYRKRGAVGDLTEEEQELVRLHRLTREQIRFRRDARANFGIRAREEFAEDPIACFLASGECVFDLEKIALRLSVVSGPVESRENGRLEIYCPPANKQYIVGVDPAGGGAEGDYSAAQVMERESGLQCAELRGHFTPREMAQRVAQLAREYDNALVAVERNNHGHAVIAQLETTEQYDNLYAQGNQLGWLTTLSNRPRMIELFAAALSSTPERFESRRLLEECRTFVRHSDGSVAAANGAHDDLVMAMAIAIAASCS